MKTRINAILAALLIAFASTVSCSKTDPGVDPGPNPDPGPGPNPDPEITNTFVTIDLAPYETDTEAIVSEEEWQDMRGYLFQDGKLTAVYDKPSDTEQGFGFEIDHNTGNFYVLTRTSSMPEMGALIPQEVSEQTWLSTLVGTQEGQPIRFLSGRTTLSEEGKNNIRMSRGFARFDLRIQTVGKAEITALVWDGCLLQTGLLSDSGIPASEPGTITTRPESPYTEDTAGVAYLYEQQNPDAVLRAEALVHGKPYLLEAKLPEKILRNQIYVVTLTKAEADQDLQLSIEPWEKGEDTNLYPDMTQQIIIDTEHSELPRGAEVTEQGTKLKLTHNEVDFELTLACNNALELMPVETPNLTVETITSSNGKNRFRVRKPLYAPGVAGESVELKFRRKGLENVYPEDHISIELLPNPVQIEGEIVFDVNSYSFDFDRYVDNELARFTIPAEKELLVEFAEGEDAWIQLTPSEESAQTIRILGGWRPNDPKADGRIQEATLIIRNAADGSEQESYRISRRNYGLPVTWLHGVWWCKYNARGNSRDFNDQILSSADPAAQAGKSLLNYLRDCSAQEFYDLWGWAYQGDSGVGMRVVEKDGILVMDGFSTDVSAHINKLPADALAPEGYELPSMEEFNRIFDATETIWMMWSGTHQLRTPWEGHSKISREQRRRNDLTIGSVQASDLIYIGMWSPDFPEHEAIVWYGPAAQWNSDGIKHSDHYNNILFGVYSPTGSGWYMTGKMAGLYMTKNGAGNRDTRILRFKKSPVEYMY